MTAAEFFEEQCGVCYRKVVSAVGPPRLGGLSYTVAPGEHTTNLRMCLHCGTELIKWMVEQREDAAR